MLPGSVMAAIAAVLAALAPACACTLLIPLPPHDRASHRENRVKSRSPKSRALSGQRLTIPGGLSYLRRDTIQRLSRSQRK